MAALRRLLMLLTVFAFYIIATTASTVRAQGISNSAPREQFRLDERNTNTTPLLTETENRLVEEALKATRTCERSILRYAFAHFGGDKHEHFVIYRDEGDASTLTFGSHNTFYNPTTNELFASNGFDTWDRDRTCE